MVHGSIDSHSVALIVYLPIRFIAVQGSDEFTAGLAILPLTAPTDGPLIAGRLARWVSPGLLSGIGFIIAAIGSLLLMRSRVASLETR